MPSHRKCFVETIPQSKLKFCQPPLHKGAIFAVHLSERTGECVDSQEGSFAVRRNRRTLQFIIKVSVSFVGEGLCALQ